MTLPELPPFTDKQLVHMLRACLAQRQHDAKKGVARLPGKTERLCREVLAARQNSTGGSRRLLDVNLALATALQEALVLLHQVAIEPRLAPVAAHDAAQALLHRGAQLLLAASDE